MAYTFARAELIGRIGNDPELKYTSAGQAVVKLSIAVDRPAKQGAEAGTDWFNVTVWGKTAEFAAQYLGKGRKVYLAGRLAINEWEGKDGKTRRSPEITAAELIALDSRTGGSKEEAADDEIPF